MRELVALLLMAALLPGPAAAALRVGAELRAALASWAEGDETAALATLRSVDQRVERDASAEAIRRAKLSLARSLARQQPAAALAFARLEERAYLAYVAERRLTLAAGARMLIPELVALSLGARRRGSEQRQPAALVLADLGVNLHQLRQEAAAAVLFEQALALDPQQRAAMLGLAAVHEKRGAYAQAVPLLEGLLRLDPAHREATLRWALNLQRTARAIEAERHLRSLAGRGGDWVQSLAAQELARVLLRRGDVAGAGSVLATALAALPCDPALPVQAALVAERGGGGQPLDLGTLAGCGDAAESARARYARPPEGEAQPLARRLVAADEEWRAALRRALPRTR